tara:strand:- start:2606 stop:3865 length:1260 start_codon:yes stop_codon:yes gene_type:complete
MSKNQIRSIKGTQDILPNESFKWQKLEQLVRSTMETYNYKEIRTPIFERTELFDRGVGNQTDIVSKEMYSWTDQGGENLTLKPELTAPVSRAFIQHNLGNKQPLTKLYYLDALFRRERPQKGRYRQFHQFGVEAFGSEHPEIDSEIIAIAVSIFKQLGIEDLRLKINSIGSNICREKYKIELKNFLKPHFDRLSETSKVRFEKNPLRILDSKLDEEIKLIEKAPSISDFWTEDDRQHFKDLCDFLSAMGIQFEIDHNLVRGLDYYSRTTFEILSSSLGAQDALCGGGRYDGLVEMIGGKSTPGIGFAAGIERILLASSHEFDEKNIEIYIIGFGENVRVKVVELVELLRENHISCDYDMLRRSMKAQLREANKMGASFAIIIGDNELKKNRVELKDLRSSEQEKISMDSIVSKLKSLSF